MPTERQVLAEAGVDSGTDERRILVGSCRRALHEQMAVFAAEVSRQSGRTVAYNDLPADAFVGLLTGIGLPEDLAALLADADVAASRGALFNDSHTLSRLIGRPTTSLETLVAAALRG